MFKPFTLNIRGKLHTYSRQAVMGIINVTPDSFYEGSRAQRRDDIRRRAEEMIEGGADMLDLGGYSSRPGAAEVSEQEETDRLALGMEAIREVAPEMPVSIDTFRAIVARTAIEELGADIINDISGGSLDPDMADTVARLHVPYILMHMRGTPATMQTQTDYKDVTAEVITDLSNKLRQLRLKGVADVIVDPGFGFAKTQEQNYEMMRHLGDFTRLLDAPLLVGISRKSMLTRLLDITPDEALNATTALNTIALMNGASILRVHDSAEASQAVRIYMACTFHSPNTIS